MRVDGFQNIPALLQSFRVDKSVKQNPETETAATASSVSLSSFAELLQSLQRESSRSAKARSEQVERLAQQAQSGNLSVNLTKLAASLVDMQVIDTKE
jgi:anti-sigma28 factor (negative regulator of flagellin synthesis)